MPEKSELNRIASSLSEGYVKMVSGYGSFVCDFGDRDSDNLAIDGHLIKIQRITVGEKTIEVKKGNIVEFQLKSCYGGDSVFIDKGDLISYKIGTDFFEKIQLNQDKFIFIIFRLPNDFQSWFEIREDYTKLQKCAFFKQVSYSDRTTWIDVPKKNLFIPENLDLLFSKPKPAKIV